MHPAQRLSEVEEKLITIMEIGYVGSPDYIRSLVEEHANAVLEVEELRRRSDVRGTVVVGRRCTSRMHELCMTEDCGCLCHTKCCECCSAPATINAAPPLAMEERLVCSTCYSIIALAALDGSARQRLTEHDCT